MHVFVYQPGLEGLHAHTRAWKHIADAWCSVYKWHAQREQRGHARGAVLTALAHASTCISTCMRERLCEGRRDKAGRRRALTAAQRHDIPNIKTLNRPSGSKPREARSDRKMQHSGHAHSWPPYEHTGERRATARPLPSVTTDRIHTTGRTTRPRYTRDTPHTSRTGVHAQTHKREPARADITSQQGNSQQGAQ